MNTHLDESDIQDLIRRTTPGPARRLDHAMLQRRGRRHRKSRQISTVVGTAALLGIIIATPLASRSLAVDPATGGRSETSSTEDTTGCPPQLASAWQCIAPTDRQRVPDAKLPQLGATPPLPSTMAGVEPQAVVLSAWATWCGPCAAQQPVLNELASDLPDNVAVVGLATTSPEDDVIDYRADHEINHPTLLDQYGTHLRQLQQIAGVETDDQGEGPLPASYVIDPSGRLAAWTSGQTSSEDLRIAVDYAIGQ